MHTDPQARIPALLEAYLAAEYRWELDGTWHRLRIGQRAPELESAFADAGSFCLLSAWNPGSEPRADGANRAADQALQLALDASGRRFRPAFAAAPNRSWREASWVVADLPLRDLDALATRFGQLGTLTWRRGEGGRLRMHAAAPAGLGPRDGVDWVK